MEKTNMIDVEKIMQEIREDIKAKGYTNDMLSFQEVQMQSDIDTKFDKNVYKHILHNLNSRNSIPWYREIPQGGIVRFVKKVVRKLCTFIIAPMSDEQNFYNGEVAKQFNQIAGYIQQTDEQLEAYKKNIQLLEQKISKLETEVEALRKEK